MKKIGRNDTCHCGSGLKYKKCHLDRERQPEITEGEVRGITSNHRIAAKCFHSSVDATNCAGKIIEAHTVSKSGSLRKIAQNGKVYHFKPDINALFDKGRFMLREIGVNQASTFPGFCAYHDKALFAPIEDQEFESTPRNTALLGYRAVAKEIFAKDQSKALVPKMRMFDKGRSVQRQTVLQNYLNAYTKGIDYSLRDLYAIKSKYNHAFASQDFSKSRYLVLRFSEPPHLLFSGSIYPEYDFAGNILQQLGDGKPLDGIAINAIATPAGGAIVFQWFDNSAVNNQLISSLLSLPNDKLASAITQFAFESFENLFIAPAWWNSLTPSHKLSLERKVSCGAATLLHSPSCFIHDGNSYASWNTPLKESNVEI